jgi:hypothetical protein
MGTKRTSNLPLICLVCGDNARGINFDLMTCMSCKTFFRRHVQQSNVGFDILGEKKISIFILFRLICNVLLKIIVI